MTWIRTLRSRCPHAVPHALWLAFAGMVLACAVATALPPTATKVPAWPGDGTYGANGRGPHPPIAPLYLPNIASHVFELGIDHHSDPNAPYRESYVSRYTWNRVDPYLVSEVSLSLEKYREGRWTAAPAVRPWQLSFRGNNLVGPFEVKGGRVWTGLSHFSGLDGVTAQIPYGRRLSAWIMGGQVSRFYESFQRSQQLYGARFHYQFNDFAFLALEGENRAEHGTAGVLAGFNLRPRLNVLGEYHTTPGTNTYRLSLDFFDNTYDLDISADYRLYLAASNTSRIESSVGKGFGRIYLEGRLGSTFDFDNSRRKDFEFYEGNLIYGMFGSLSDGIRLGYMYEHVPETWCHSFSAEASKMMLRHYRVGLNYTTSRYNDGRASTNEVQGRLHRLTPWGFWEWQVGVTTNSVPSPNDTHTAVRTGINF